jgi:hypothetical protein
MRTEFHLHYTRSIRIDADFQKLEKKILSEGNYLNIGGVIEEVPVTDLTGSFKTSWGWGVGAYGSAVNVNRISQPPQAFGSDSVLTYVILSKFMP